MLNVMEERDIQIRGYVLRLPLDVLVMASANPEDYTNRGRIITPLKDRFGAEIRTHYRRSCWTRSAIIRQEVGARRRCARLPRRDSCALHPCTSGIQRRRPAQRRQRTISNRRSGETIAAAAIHRASRQGEDDAVARPVDLETAVDVLGGKIEFESGEEGREDEILDHLLRTATAETVRAHFAGLDFGVLVDAIEAGVMVTTGRAGHGEGLPVRAAGAGRVRALRRHLRATGRDQRRPARRSDRVGLSRVST